MPRGSWTVKYNILNDKAFWLIFFFKIRINSYSVIKCRECSHGKREVLDLNPGRALYPLPSPVTFGGSVWIRAQTASSRGTVSSRWYLLGSEQIRGCVYLSRGSSSSSSASMVWESSWVRVRSGHVLFNCDIYSMTSFDIEVIEINTITQYSVPAYKYNHTGVGAKITQESLHVLSHFFV